MLMPLLMVGQNLQGRHSDARAENDYLVNEKSFADTEKILKQLDYVDSRGGGRYPNPSIS